MKEKHPQWSNSSSHKQQKQQHYFHISRSIHTEPFLFPIQSKEYWKCGAEQQHNRAEQYFLRRSSSVFISGEISPFFYKEIEKIFISENFVF